MSGDSDVMSSGTADAADPWLPIRRRFEGGHGPIECEDGWLDLVLRLDERLNAISPNYYLRQCKSKFAGLRYYAGHGGDLTDEEQAAFTQAIREAERESEHTCEICGAAGELDERFYYVRTLCPTHFDERGAEEAAYRRGSKFPSLEGTYTFGWGAAVGSLGRALYKIDRGLVVFRVWSSPRKGLQVGYHPSDPDLRPELDAKIAETAEAVSRICERCGTSENAELRWDSNGKGGNTWPVAVLCDPCLAYHEATISYGGEEGHPTPGARYHLPAAALVFTETADGQLNPVQHRKGIRAQAVLDPETGKLSWAALAEYGDIPDVPYALGRPVPAVVIRGISAGRP